ncbi:hypothetical protein GCM10022287_22080 [Gryllotalpicola koreensis]|uniref:Helix-turn-helix domain-containing protein n=1 Tax=Gryllotalpicola koreensis TaxID=993086 RepID=A0ABP8A219_9MICO
MREWLTLVDAAELVGRNKRTVQRWASAGLVDTWRPFRSVLYRRVQLLAVEARMDDAAAHPSFGRDS